MWSQTLLTTSGGGSGSEPTTAASSLDGCNGFIRAGLTFLADAPVPALAVWAGPLFAAVVLRFASLGMVALLPIVQIGARNQDTASWPISMAHSAPRLSMPVGGRL